MMATMGLHAADEQFELQQHVARGVYWPWERTKLHAAHAGMEFWAFVDHLMARIKSEWNCNLVWFVNGPSEPAKVCDLAEQHGLLVLSGTRLAGIFVHGLRGEAQLDRAVRDTVEALGAKKALGAYVLKDEAKNVEKAQMETFREALAAADPTHPSIIVTMTGHTEAFAVDSGFPIICTDIYHFGGDRSTAIPNPARRSRATFRGCVEALTDMTERHGKTAWSMPQAFVDVWGASWLDDRGHVVIEPGSYWHWRMPTVPEMRWQIWESVRAGCKGVVFFSPLLGGASDWTPAKGDMPEKMQQALERNRGKWPVTARRIETGQPVCLSSNGGGSTPQALAMATAFAALEKLDPLIVRWRPARLPVVFADAPARVRCYADPRDPAVRYAVVVNDDTAASEERLVTLRFLPGTSAVVDAVRDTRLELGGDEVANEKLLRTQLTLAPGDGTVLRLSFAGGRPGLLLYDEDFSKAAVTAGLEGVSRQPERRGFGMGSSWRVRKSGEADEDALITVDGLQSHHHGRGSAVLTAMRELGKGTALVYLLVDGNCPKPESIVVQFVDGEGNAGWDKTDAYHLPIALRADVAAVRIRLAADAAVDRVRLWRVEEGIQ